VSALRREVSARLFISRFPCFKPPPTKLQQAAELTEEILCSVLVLPVVFSLLLAWCVPDSLRRRWFSKETIQSQNSLRHHWFSKETTIAKKLRARPL
jgi:hypothetical protein